MDVDAVIGADADTSSDGLSDDELVILDFERSFVHDYDEEGICSQDTAADWFPDVLMRSPERVINRLLGPHQLNIPAKAFLDLSRQIIANPYLRMNIIDLKNCDISSESLQVISTLFKYFPNMSQLDLDYNFLGPRGLSWPLTVNLFETVTRLTLVDNDLGDEGASMVAKGLRTSGCCLRYLDLAANQIHAAGAKEIGNALPCCCLEWLNLQCNAIGNEGFGGIMEGLRRNSTLEKLFVGHNFITEKSVEQLFTTIMLNTRLETLHLNDNFVSAKSLDRIQRALAKYAKRADIQPVVALAFGTIHRLGAKSVVYSMPQDVLRTVRDFCSRRPEW